MNPIVSAIISYLSSVWSTLRIVFGAFDSQTMINLAQLLTVIFVIGVADNLGSLFNRTKDKIKKKKTDDDEDEEYLYIRVRK